jgi:signal transduction histidine kinase
MKAGRMNNKMIQVLFFEDNSGDVRLIKEFLREDDMDQYTLIHVERLDAGIKYLTQEKPDVIMLDLGLPDSQGLETFTKVYAQAAEVPIVILTGLNDFEHAVTAVKAGAQDYLVKGEGDGATLVRSLRYAIERKRTEQKLKEYSEHLEAMVDERTRELRESQAQIVRNEKLAVLGQLAGGVGHELRNPLGVINTSVYYLKLAQPEAGKKIKQHISMIEQEVRNADKIISDLLDFAQNNPAELEQVQVGKLVRETLEKFPVPETIKVTLDLPDNLPDVIADPRQVGQVLGNLTVNACQSMSPKGGRLTIFSSVHNDLVTIGVRDTGTGISPENIKKIFEPLFTTKAKGIGLGLAVSWKLAESNGGRIEVESEPGKGSTFTLLLPTYISEKDKL